MVHSVTTPTLGHEAVTLPTFRCLRCGNRWSPRKPKVPARCGRCKSPYWRTRPRKRVAA